LLFWWNPLCVIKVNLKPNPLFFSLFCISYLFIFLSSCWAYVLVCEWWRELLVFYLGYGHQELQKSCVYAHPRWSDFQGLVWKKKNIQGLVWKKKNKDDNKNDTKNEWMKSYEGLKPWSLFFGLSGFTHEIIGP